MVTSSKAPAVEAPAVEAPAVEAPAVEAPAVEAPKSEEPTVADAVAQLRISLKAHPTTPFASQIETNLNTIEGFLTAR